VTSKAFAILTDNLSPSPGLTRRSSLVRLEKDARVKPAQGE